MVSPWPFATWGIDIIGTLQEDNEKANSLVKLASLGDAQLMGLVPVEQLDIPSIDQLEVESVLKTEPEKESWMTPIKNYLL